MPTSNQPPHRVNLSRLDDVDVRLVHDEPRSMSQAVFRHRLTTLLNEFLAGGGDPFWVFRELATAGEQLTDDLRCDLMEPPF